jgi:ribosomal protein S18 acetylase RimI-like enzyme
MDSVAAIESAGYDTWTPDVSATIAGWQVYATEGHTRRVNCATGKGDLPTDPDVRAAIVNWLAEREAAPTIRVTPLLSERTVEQVKQRWGYRAVDETHVMTTHVIPSKPAGEFSLRELDDEAFVADLLALNGRSIDDLAVRLRLFGRVADRGIGFSIPTVAAGVVVGSGRYAAVYSVAVAPDHRRRGIAHRMMAAATHWAGEFGCETMFLQVLGNNTPAVRLYESIGYTEQYRYHYLEPSDVGESPGAQLAVRLHR